MSNSVISLGLGLGGGRSATSSGRSSGGGGAFANEFSVSLDGTNDHVKATSDPNLTVNSMSCWFKPTSTLGALGADYLVGGFGKGGLAVYGGIRVQQGATRVLEYNDGTQYISAGGVSSIDTNWHNVIIVHVSSGYTTTDGTATTSGKGYKIFLDGVRVDSELGSASHDYTLADTTSVFKLGEEGQRGGSNFGGLLDEVAIFSSSLSDSDVAAIYNSGVPADLSDFSPTLWWRCGENDSGTGTTITDQGSGGTNGTLINGAAFSTTVPTATRFSRVAVNLDGTNDYMELDTGSINLYGFSCWFKSNEAFSASSGNFAVLLGQSGTSYFLALGGDITGDFTNELITIRASSQNSFAYTSASATIDTGWHHIVGAWSTSAATTGGNGYDIYLDGVKVGNAAGSATPSSPYVIGSSAFRIGQRQNGAYPFDGSIDEVSLFTSALSASDIATLYNSGVPGDISSLSPFGWWRMGENNNASGTTITDQGSGSNNGTLTNGPTFVFNTP